MAQSVGTGLADHNFGIICLTSTNQTAPWILFEAGAISKFMEGAHVCVLLIGLNKSEVKPPLSQFQLTLFENEEIEQLLLAINSALKDLALAPAVLDRSFEWLWPSFESIIKQIPPDEGAPVPTRTADDKLDEILLILRQSARVEPVRFEVERSSEKPVSYYHFLMNRLAKSVRSLNI